MNATNDPADVIEPVSCKHKFCAECGQNIEHWSPTLADPADRDELAKVREERDYHHARADVMLAKLSSSIALRGGKPGDFWKEWHKSHCGAVEAAERAEAEVARLNGALTARSAALNARIDSAEKIAKDVMAERDELRATVDRCREFLSEPVAVLSDGAVRDAYRMARAALDPEGGAS